MSNSRNLSDLSVVLNASVANNDISYSGTLTGGTGIINIGIGQFYKDANGSFGIGTTSPATGLQVQRNSANGTTYAIYTDNGAAGSGTNVAGIGFSNAGAMKSSITAGVYGNDFMAFNVAGSGTTERMRIDSGGNLGLGVTPSAWAAAWKVLEGQGGFLGSNATSGIVFSNNSYSNGTNWIYKNTAAASQYFQLSGQHQWYNAPSGTAGNAITFTQAMTLDASGNLGIGVSPSYKLEVRGSSTSGSASVFSAITVPDTNGNRGGFGIGNASGGLFAGIAGQQITGGNYPNSVGRLDVWVQNSASTTTAATFDASGNLGVNIVPVSNSLSLAETKNLSWIWASNGYNYANIFNQTSSAALILASGYQKSGNSYAFASSIPISWSRSAISVNNFNISFYTDPAATVAVGTDITPTERMRIDSSGMTTFNGTIKNAAGIKRYSISYQNPGATNYVFELMRISRDSANWSTQIGYEITIYNEYYRGGVSKWFVDYNQVNSGTVYCIGSSGTLLMKLYLGTEVTVSGTIKYRPVLIDVPSYQFMRIEVAYSTSEVASISAQGQVQFVATGSAGGGGSNYTGEMNLMAGLGFPATQVASSDANTLDDYEEGTWTPTLGGNTTYTQQGGTYVKIGRFVFCNFIIQVNLIGTGSAKFITGLPYAYSNSVARTSGSLGYVANSGTNAYSWLVNVDGQGVYFNPYQSLSNVIAADAANMFTSGTYLIGSFQYTTST